VTFYHEVVAEMRKVTWPDREQLKDTTIKIIIFVLFIGAILGILDVLLQLILVQGIPSLFTGR
jgi:preprotein translocase subunit SecE